MLISPRRDRYYSRYEHVTIYLYYMLYMMSVRVEWVSASVASLRGVCAEQTDRAGKESQIKETRVKGK